MPSLYIRIVNCGYNGICFERGKKGGLYHKLKNKMKFWVIIKKGRAGKYLRFRLIVLIGAILCANLCEKNFAKCAKTC